MSERAHEAIGKIFPGVGNEIPEFRKKSKSGVQEVTPLPGPSKTHPLSEAAV